MLCITKNIVKREVMIKEKNHSLYLFEDIRRKAVSVFAVKLKCKNLMRVF